MHNNDRSPTSSSVADFAPNKIVQAALVAAGVLFVLYPAIRPFSDEKGIDGAKAFASRSWLVAHSFAIVGFVLLAFGLLGITGRLHRSASGQLANRAFLLAGAGIGLTLPFYGAEVFGLHAIGKEALKRGDPTLVAMSDSVRFGVGIVFIVVGLALLAIGTVMLARAVWRAGVLPRWSAVPLAVAFVLYLPQFSAGQAVRVAHGFLVLAGCVALACGLRRAEPAEVTRDPTANGDKRSPQLHEAAAR